MLHLQSGDDFGVEPTVESDEGVFLSLPFEAEDGREIEFQCTNPTDIEEFFRLTDKAKADYERLTGKTLP
jgi:hypothetical protein